MPDMCSAPLREYRNENVQLRLPAGWKTFDISFISVFNEAQRISYGHSLIPPAVVPPCDDNLGQLIQ